MKGDRMNRQRKIFLRGTQTRLRFIFCLFLIISFLHINQAAAGGEKVIQRDGDNIQLMLPAAAYAATFIMKDPEGRKQFYKSFLWNIAVTQVLKHAINRQRPRGHGNYSFPSGHTSASFQAACFIQRRYGWKYSIPFYAGATFVGYSRVERHMHYVSDVIGGAIVGIVSNILFTKPYKGVHVSPVADKNFYGLRLSKKW